MATVDLFWCPLSAWIGPGAALFIFFNVLIGAIAVTSREQAGHGPASGRGTLCRSASSMALDRLRSFSLFSMVECYCHTSIEADEQQMMRGSASEPAAAEPQNSPAEPLAIDAASIASETHKEDSESSQEEKPGSSAEAKVQDPCRQHIPASKDDEVAAAERPRKKKLRKRAKGHERANGRGAEEVKAELNDRAEMFIRQFREDLKLQRLNSIINYSRAFGCRGSVALETN